MKLVCFSLVVIYTLAVCFGNAIPANIMGRDAGAIDLQAKRLLPTNGFKAKCGPGLWCSNSKRESLELNHLSLEQTPKISEHSTSGAEERSLEQTVRKYRCMPGLHCSQIAAITSEKPERHLPSSARRQINVCVKYPFLCELEEPSENH